VDSSSQITARLTVNVEAALGTRDVTVTNGSFRSQRDQVGPASQVTARHHHLGERPNNDAL